MLSPETKRGIEKSKAIISDMLVHIETQMEDLKTQDFFASLWNEKDSLLSAHSRIIQLQVKLAESELRFKHEELKLKKMKKDLLESGRLIENTEEQLPPLTQEEWDALFYAFKRHKDKLENDNEDSNYAVLLK